MSPCCTRAAPRTFSCVTAGASTWTWARTPEYATAECDRLEDLLEQDRAGSDMLADLALQADEALAELGTDLRLHLFRNTWTRRATRMAATRTTCCTAAATSARWPTPLLRFS